MKPYIVFLAVLIISLFGLLADTDTTGAENGKNLVIAYSNNVEGYLEPCG